MCADFSMVRSELGKARLAEALRHVIMDRQRASLRGMLRAGFGVLSPGAEFRDNWHLDVLCEYLAACERREIRRLVINMPPRSLKSLTVSVMWPAFLLGRNPEERIIAASYSAGLSVKHSLDCRTLMQSPLYQNLFPQTMLAEGQREKHRFATTRQGYRLATSVGGTVTGIGGNILIMDDPQNPAQAMSESGRRMANEWFDQTFSTRLDDKRQGVMLVVMQRLHENDLTGHLLERGGWEQLVLPAIADRRRIYTMGGVRVLREEGSILHACREDEQLLQEARSVLGSVAFSAQYLQAPVPLAGNMVKREWLIRYRQRPEGWDRIVQSWDTAIKAGDQHDHSVCLTFGEKEGIAYLLDALRIREEFPELRKTIIRMAEEFGTEAILLEDKASGQSLLQDLRRSERRLPLIAVMPTRDKVTRFAAVTPQLEAGHLALPEDATWLAEFERELLGFPQAEHDDQVDALSQYLSWRKNFVKPAHRIRRL